MSLRTANERARMARYREVLAAEQRHNQQQQRIARLMHWLVGIAVAGLLSVMGYALYLSVGG